MGRIFAPRLSEILRRQVIVENMGAAAGIVATNRVAHAAPDGYLFLLGTSGTHAYNPALYKKLPYNAVTDFAPVALFAEQPMVLLANKDLPVNTLPEFIRYVKANGSKLQFGSARVGSTTHLGCALLNATAGLNVTHVPYRGGPPAVSDLLSGHIQVMSGTVLLVIEHIESGTLRALAVTDAARSDLLPDTPTVGEFVPGFAASTWSGVGVPKDTPSAIVHALNAEINAALADATMKARIAGLGAAVLGGTPTDFGKLLVDETEKWGKVVKSAGIKPA